MARLSALFVSRFCMAVVLCACYVGIVSSKKGNRGYRKSGSRPPPLFDNDTLDDIFNTPEPVANQSLTRKGRYKRQLVIPNGLTVGIIPRFDYVVFSNSDGEQLVVSVDVEIDYTFPTMASSSGSGKSSLNRISRLLYDKKNIYSGLETVFTRFGLNGRACTLRAICEVGEVPDHQDGILGDFLGYLLSASYGLGRHQELKKYYQAEYIGRKYGNCAAVFPSCPISIFKLVDAFEGDDVEADQNFAKDMDENKENERRQSKKTSRKESQEPESA